MSCNGCTTTTAECAVLTVMSPKTAVEPQMWRHIPPPSAYIRPTIVPVVAGRVVVTVEAGRGFLPAAFDPPPLHPANRASPVKATA
jgi:hypothetical protein